MSKDGMLPTCSTNGRVKKFEYENLNGRDQLLNVGVDTRILLKCKSI
jgi:hypothetical protein